MIDEILKQDQKEPGAARQKKAKDKKTSADPDFDRPVGILRGITFSVNDWKQINALNIELEV